MLVPAERSNTAGDPSGGPNTREGKEIARWNATRHGIRSPAPVVPGVEKQEDWEEFRDGILEDLAPLGSLELALAERVALLSWRLHRVTRYETETIARAQESVEDDLASRRRFDSHSRGPIHPEDALAAPIRLLPASLPATCQLVSSSRCGCSSRESFSLRRVGRG